MGSSKNQHKLKLTGRKEKGKRKEACHALLTEEADWFANKPNEGTCVSLNCKAPIIICCCKPVQYTELLFIDKNKSSDNFNYWWNYSHHDWYKQVKQKKKMFYFCVTHIARSFAAYESQLKYM